jgi:hypothetical protein
MKYRVRYQPWWAGYRMAVLVLALMAGLFGHVWLGSGIRNVEYQIGELEGRKAMAMREAKALEAEMASLMSMAEVDRRGLALGLPDRENIVYVVRDKGELARMASYRVDLGLHEFVQAGQ